MRTTIDQLLAVAKEVRQNPLVLEQLETDDPFLKTGIQLITSTSDPERVHEVLDAEIDGLRVRHAAAIKFFSDMAGYSPTFGILGTVIGLIGVLGQLQSPGKLGPAIAVGLHRHALGRHAGQRRLAADVQQAPAALRGGDGLPRDGHRGPPHDAAQRLEHGPA